MNDSDSLSPEDGWRAANDVGRRTRSCAECRRRRVRCDGSTVPCRQCAYYLVPHLCHYPPRKVRRSPSIKLYTELSNAYETSQGILRKLFPFTATTELASMSRTQLLDMANNAQSASSCSGSPAAQETVENVSAEGLQTLQPSPDEEFGWDELADKRAIAARGPLIEDDVNGLSLINGASPPSSSSYLGFTSIPSMIRILLKVTPQCRGGVSQQAFASLPPAKSRSGQVVQPINLSTCEIDEAAFVDAYFLRVHSITPMVDEADFRRRMAVDKGCMEEHTSGSWQALKNMVLALGSIAGTDASQPTHILYYQRASQYFDLSCLGSGHIHTVQALALLGGFYLHYCNRPNMAGAVMGATVRLAVGMGLHLAEQSSPASGKGHASLARQKDVEIRIRTWWSVICLDTWAGTTLGRPDVGCVGKDLVSTSLPTLRFSMDYEAISLRASRSFCQIAGRIQGRLGKRTIMSLNEVQDFDEEMKAWWEDLHPLFREDATVPESLRTARGLLWWRYWTTRLTLYRPHLLKLALKETITGLALTAEELSLIRMSGDIGVETVQHIVSDWFPNQMSAWHGVWHMFQAGLALLVVMSVDYDPGKFETWDRGVRTIVSVLPEMEKWSPGAARSLDAIQYLLARVKPVPNNSGAITPQTFLDNQDDMDLLDQMLADGSDWFDINEANFVYS